MKKLLSLLLALCLCILPVCAADYEESADDLPWSAQDWAVLRLTNERRLESGLSPLSMTVGLWEAACTRCSELHTLVEHVRPDGRSCFTVLDEHGISFVTAGENIAAGQPDAASIVEAWMGSPAHRENILNGSFSHLGASYLAGALGDEYISYWSQLFADDSCRFSDLQLLDADHLVVPPGTPVEDLRITARLSCSAHGASYLPVIDGMCSGYDSSLPGEQTVTVSCRGQTAVFTVTVSSEAHAQTPVASSSESSMSVFRPRSEYYYLFTDVPDSAWYYDSVYLSVAYGLLSGTGAGSFAPEEPLTVAQTLMIAARIRSLYNGGDGVISQEGAVWYAAARDCCIREGIISAGDFSDADRPATRREVARILAHALPVSELSAIRSASAPDVAEDDPAAWEIGMLYRAGVLIGDAHGNFNPESTIRRCEAAAILVRLILPARRIG